MQRELINTQSVFGKEVNGTTSFDINDRAVILPFAFSMSRLKHSSYSTLEIQTLNEYCVLFNFKMLSSKSVFEP